MGGSCHRRKMELEKKKKSEVIHHHKKCCQQRKHVGPTKKSRTVGFKKKPLEGTVAVEPHRSYRKGKRNATMGGKSLNVVGTLGKGNLWEDLSPGEVGLGNKVQKL